MRAWLAEVVGRLEKGLDSTCRKHGAERLVGRAAFDDSRAAATGNQTVPRVRFRPAIIATGAAPVAHEHLPFDGRLMLTAHEALAVPAIPEPVLVVGGNGLGLELATIYAGLGSNVWRVDEADRLLPEADADFRPGAGTVHPQRVRRTPGVPHHGRHGRHQSECRLRGGQPAGGDGVRHGGRGDGMRDGPTS